MPRVRGAGGSLDLAGVRCLHAAVTRSFTTLRAWDVAQVGAGHLDHPADAAVEFYLATSEDEASSLFNGDLWRDRKSIGIGDELDQFGVGARYGFAHVAGRADAPVREVFAMRVASTHRTGAPAEPASEWTKVQQEVGSPSVEGRSGWVR
jgi:hypothetical protein